ncbi:MAG TPA: IS1 family transposase [Phycisphaerales bacterium]|nr:IS1 family transposase [Phycisphaerales bacterium]
MNRLTTADRVRIVACLTEGCSIRSTCRLTGFSKKAVTQLLCDIGQACANFHSGHVVNVEARRVQADELWCFVGAKDKTISKRRDLQAKGGIGSAWTWVALDADTKLAITWLVGQKDAESARDFMEDLASRVTCRMQLTTDGFKPYYIAVPRAFGNDIDFARIVKKYGNPQPDGRIGTAQLECVACKREGIIGNPDPKHISTSFIERSNLTTRMASRRFTRLTNAFSKKWANLAYAVALHYTFYNFCRVHSTLRVTPAMQAGLTDHVWEIEELVGLLEREEAAIVGTDANKRGPYRKDSK